MVKIEHPVFSMVEPGDTVRQKNGLCGVFECFIVGDNDDLFLIVTRQGGILGPYSDYWHNDDVVWESPLEVLARRLCQ